jgi:hypothetical protein
MPLSRTFLTLKGATAASDVRTHIIYVYLLDSCAGGAGDGYIWSIIAPVQTRSCEQYFTPSGAALQKYHSPLDLRGCRRVIIFTSDFPNLRYMNWREARGNRSGNELNTLCI